MRFDVITLFPELFEPFLKSGVTRRAFESGRVRVHLHNLRDHAQGNYKRVDDRPFGGGPGMVMMAEPLAACVEAIQSERRLAELNGVPKDVPVILFSPTGVPLGHGGVQSWSQSGGALLVCGRYEGLDQRFIDRVITHQISLGDFVLSGGEIAALALLDAVARLVPGVLNDANSSEQDSFNPAIGGLLDCPHYTRPEVWRDVGVPPVLLSGHHEQIEHWRQAERVALTRSLRPDLLK